MVCLLMLGGLQLLSIGILGEYIGRIAKEVRNRPLYVVESDSGQPHDSREEGEPWTSPRMQA
jgi:hypothetical protein